eukprot:TRINITY_DN9046_c0_g1_i1.p1 TRINITY_DN9046_c0_g1~~TRINITY_DN9046_c0_g1_i1.p1  ORF type:complete len:1113 (+),score=320.46 TRINITY_DN9046_c0_g1_i1:64-3339(+)
MLVQRRNAAAQALQRASSMSVFGVLAVAMLFSSVASIIGGVIMYYESLSSLEDSVRETSEADVLALEQEIRDQSYGRAWRVNGMQVGMHYTSRLLTHDWQTWRESHLHTALGMYKSDESYYGSAFVFFPENGREEEFLYIGHWADPLRDGSAQFVTSGYNPENVTRKDGVWQARIKAWEVNPRLGNAAPDHLYTWDCGFYLDWNLTTLALPTAAQQNSSFYDISRVRMRAKSTFASADGRLTSYSGWDALYRPPPPPHPWSIYKHIMSITWFRYDTWAPIMERYARSRAAGDTSVVLFDRLSHGVHASTTGAVGYDQGCWDTFQKNGQKGDLPSCAMRLVNMTTKEGQVLRAVGEKLNATHAGSQFKVVSVGGEGYFARWSEVEGLQANTILLWVRPKSSVEHKVAAALTLLVVFACTVLCFDSLILAMEIVMVGLPLRDVSKAVKAVGKMDTDGAFNRLEGQCHRRFHVTEMLDVVSGMADTISNLDEFKMYLPASTIAAALDEEGEGEDHGAGAPSGTVAIVFTDIVGSSQLWEDVPKTMSTALDLHWHVLRVSLLKHRGYEVKTIGDSLMASFADPQDAFLFATEVQVDMTRQEWPEDLLQFGNTAEVLGEDGACLFRGLQIRIGIHYGSVDIEMNPLTGRADYRSNVVNQAARIESVALPGMVAFSEEVLQHLTFDKHSLPVHSLGLRELKGIGNVKLHYATHRALAGRDGRFAVALLSGGSPSLERGARSPRVGARRATSIDARRSMDGSVSASDGFETRRPPARNAPLDRDMKRSNGTVMLMESYLYDCDLDRARHSNDSNSELSGTSAADSVLNLANSWLQRTTDMCTMTHGTIESVSGSLAVVSWGILTKDPQPTLQALRFIGATSKRLTAMRPTYGAVAGPFLHGHVGSNIRRFHTILGAGFAYARSMLQMCAVYEASALLGRAGRMPAAFADCCTPVDVYTTRGEYGPCLVVEKLDVRACATLKVEWDMPRETFDAQLEMHDADVKSLSATDKFRYAMFIAAIHQSALKVDTSGLPPALAAVAAAAAEQGAGFATKMFPQHGRRGAGTVPESSPQSPATAPTSTVPHPIPCFVDDVMEKDV